MSNVEILRQPSGLINGQPWPAVGEQIELPDSVAEAMAEAKWVKVLAKPAKKAEKRPASKANVETRKA